MPCWPRVLYNPLTVYIEAPEMSGAFFITSIYNKQNNGVLALYLSKYCPMKQVFSLYFLLFTITFFGQGNQPWRSHYSYNDIVDVTQSSTTFIGAAGSALFSMNMANNELKTITSVDGLKTEGVSAVYYSTTYKKTLVGNSNGLLLIINADNSINARIDIIQENNITAAKKKINHIYEHEGKAYLSCDFGIAVYDLATMEFGDTYLLAGGGIEAVVAQCTVLAGSIYAAVPGFGIYTASLANPNLNDFSQWYTVVNGAYHGVVTYNDTLFFTDSTGAVYRMQNGQPVIFVTMPSIVTDIREASGYLIVTCAGRINVYDGLTQATQVNFISGEITPTTFSCSTIIGNTLYIGTQEKGVFTTSINSLSFSNITPDGPLRSSIFAMEKTASSLWAVFGGYDPITYNPDLGQYGISKLTEQGWLSIPNNELFNAASISDIIVNPGNNNEVYAGSFHSGLIKIVDDVPVAIYDHNSDIDDGPESLFDPDAPDYESTRINSLAFDKNGNLWMTNSLIENSIKVLKANNTWDTYSIEDVLPEPQSYNNKMTIDKNGTKWIPTGYAGLLAFNEQPLKFMRILNDENTGNLPSISVTCTAVDNNNRLWIGTSKGLRILTSVDRFMTDDELSTNPIIILEDGVAQELMFEQGITDIVVDGSNNKWIATGSAGAFLVSPDGQQTLFHFTKENSPLPSNTINDIEIDNITGEVFFATPRGMVSYAGTSTEASGDLRNVYVFPNPVRPEFEGDVNISGLMDQVNLKITDIEGNLVYETTSEGGTVLWDTRAFGKYKVASGVYMIFISSEDGTQTKVKKVMIIR